MAVDKENKGADSEAIKLAGLLPKGSEAEAACKGSKEALQAVPAAMETNMKKMYEGPAFENVQEATQEKTSTIRPKPSR